MKKYQINDNLVGKVTSVKPYALFLEFEDGAKGLLHISEISDSYVKDIERYGTIGDEIRVKIIDIDKSNGFLRVSLKKVEECERYSTHDNSKKLAQINVDENAFKTIRENLPLWIEEKINSIKGEK